MKTKNGGKKKKRGEKMGDEMGQGQGQSKVKPDEHPWECSSWYKANALHCAKA